MGKHEMGRSTERHKTEGSSFSVHTCKPGETFWSWTNSVMPSEARRASEGGSGGPYPEIFKNLYWKWCNLSHSWAIFVNTISLYCNKTCIKRKL